MPEENLPPQSRRVALYAAGGAFSGVLLALLLAWLLGMDCCCEPELKTAATDSPPPMAATLSPGSA